MRARTRWHTPGPGFFNGKVLRCYVARDSKADNIKTKSLGGVRGD